MPESVQQESSSDVQSHPETGPQESSSDVESHPETYGMTKEDLEAASAADSKAWKAVTGLLLLIVIGGVLLGALGVMIASRL